MDRHDSLVGEDPCHKLVSEVGVRIQDSLTRVRTYPFISLVPKCRVCSLVLLLAETFVCVSEAPGTQVLWKSSRYF